MDSPQPEQDKSVVVPAKARPIKSRPLTPKERRVVKALVKTPDISYSQLGDATGMTPAGAWLAANRPIVKSAIAKVLEKSGMGLERIAQEVARGLEAGKIASHGDYLDKLISLHGLVSAPATKTNAPLIQIMQQVTSEGITLPDGSKVSKAGYESWLKDNQSHGT